MPTVEVVVSEGQKADWKNFVEEAEAGQKYDSVSDLVRKAVQNQISRDMGEEGSVLGIRTSVTTMTLGKRAYGSI